MTYVHRFSLGCVVIAVLSFFGCATGPGTLLPQDAGTAVVFGSHKPDPEVSDGDTALAVVRGDRWWKGD